MPSKTTLGGSLQFLPKTTLMHKNDSQTIILRGMRMKFSPNVRDIISKNLQQ